MFDFWKKESDKKEESEKYMDYVSRTALPGIKEGNVCFVNSLQRIFTIKDAVHYHIEAADCFLGLIDGISAKKMCQLDERCRSYSEYYWNWQDKVDWKSDRLKREELSYLTNEQYAATLCVGTFHSDGYCRQLCVESLKEWENSLSYLVLRLNDWVAPVRDSAFVSAMHRISVCEIAELFSALPMFDKVKNSGRWERPQVEEIEQAIQQQMRVKFSDCRLWEIPRYEVSVKNSIYRFVNQNEILDLLQLEQLMTLEKSSYGKRMLVQTILRQQDCDEARIFRYLQDKSSVVRYHAMEHYYGQRQDAWDGLEGMLLDKARKVRDNAAFILRKHRAFDVLGYYRDQLEKGNDKVALLGIGENGTEKELNIVAPYLNDADVFVRKTALIAYGMLAKEQGEDVYWAFLKNPDQLLYIQAYRLIVKYGIRYGAKAIYEEYMECREKPVAYYLLRLLTREPSWKRLPYLLMLCDDAALSENMKGHILYGIRHRSMYGSVTRQEADAISKLLDEKKNCLPERTAEGILWDLKFVTR